MAFGKIRKEFNDTTWNFIYLLIDRTESIIIKDFFVSKEKKECDLIIKSRYRQLDDVLSEKMYYESEVERQLENSVE